MLKGDVLLNKADHTALVQADGGTTVEARGTSFGIVTNVPYRNYPWDCVLRYTKDGGGYIANWVEREIPNIGKSLATKSYGIPNIYEQSQADINTCGAVTAVRQTADCESTKILFVWHSVRITDRTARLLRLNLTTVK